jgi:hypothetical protein
LLQLESLNMSFGREVLGATSLSKTVTSRAVRTLRPAGRWMTDSPGDRPPGDVVTASSPAWHLQPGSPPPRLARLASLRRIVRGGLEAARIDFIRKKFSRARLRLFGGTRNFRWVKSFLPSHLRDTRRGTTACWPNCTCCGSSTKQDLTNAPDVRLGLKWRNELRPQ